MLDLITPVNDVFRRDLEVFDANLVDPTQVDAIEQGEWLVREAGGKLVRVGGASVAGAMQVFSQKGDLATQALGKIAMLQLHDYEAETDIFDSGLASAAIGVELTAEVSTIDAVARGALKAAVTGDYVYGVVTKGPADNGGKLRFQKTSPYMKHA